MLALIRPSRQVPPHHRSQSFLGRQPKLRENWGTPSPRDLSETAPTSWIARSGSPYVQGLHVPARYRLRWQDCWYHWWRNVQSQPSEKQNWQREKVAGEPTSLPCSRTPKGVSRVPPHHHRLSPLSTCHRYSPNHRRRAALVALHSDFDWLIIARSEFWQVGGVDGESDGSGDAGLSCDEAGFFSDSTI